MPYLLRQYSAFRITAFNVFPDIVLNLANPPQTQPPSRRSLPTRHYRGRPKGIFPFGALLLISCIGARSYLRGIPETRLVRLITFFAFYQGLLLVGHETADELHVRTAKRPFHLLYVPVLFHLLHGTGPHRHVHADSTVPFHQGHHIVRHHRHALCH